MTQPETWHTAKLFNLAGQHIGNTRVPKSPMPPPLILWSNRYFILALPDGDYMETRCHMVPLERMYVSNPKAASLPFRKAEK